MPKLEKIQFSGADSKFNKKRGPSHYTPINILGISESHNHLNHLITDLKRNALPTLKIIVVSDFTSPDNWLRLYREGVSGCVEREKIDQQLLKSIIHVKLYGSYLSERYHHFFIKEMLELKYRLNCPYNMLLNKEAARQFLSNRECDVYELIIQGKNAIEISKKLYISLSTVTDHTNAIFKILKVNNRTSAIITGLKKGLII